MSITPSIITATKEFSFDCAHMLSGHEGLCSNVHGHTYKMQVQVRRDRASLCESGPSAGMVVDFKDLKQVVNDHIIYHFDHAFVFYKHGNEVEKAVGHLLLSHGMKVAEVSYRPTAENVAKSFFQILSEAFKNSPIIIESVRLWETPTSYAEACR